MSAELILPTIKAAAASIQSLFAGEVGGAAVDALNVATLKRRAIRDTGSAFPRDWHVAEALRDWSKTTDFEFILYRFGKGERPEQADDITVRSFLEEGHFASGLGEEREARARKVVTRFFNELLRRYMNTPEGLDLWRRRQERSQDHTREALGVLLRFVEDQRQAQTARDARKVATLEQYAQTVMKKSRLLPLQVLDATESDARRKTEPMLLDKVYQDLDTTTVERDAEPGPGDWTSWLGEETQKRSALDVIAEHRHVVLIGEPGSGKSTFLRHLALCFAGHVAEPEEEWMARLPAWPEAEPPPLPVLVQLRDLAYACRNDWEEREKGTAGHLWDFVLYGQRDLPGATALLERHAVPGQEQLIVILDGLDEIPGAAARTFVRDAVADFLARHPGCRVVVTCRTRSYQNPASQLEGVPDFELASFDEARIDAFNSAWHDELVRTGRRTQTEAEVLQQRLHVAVRRKDLWPLAANPLLLTVMAWVHTHRERLPEARALLYEQMVDLLLWDWDESKAEAGDEEPTLRALLPEAERSEIDLRRVLWALAYEAHAEGGLDDEERLADLHEWSIRKAVAALHPNSDERHAWAERVLRLLRLRAGLLQEREPEVYTFPHRTFQEYLAGAHLASENTREEPIEDRLDRLFEESALWRMPVLLAVGRLVYVSGDYHTPLAIAGRLCPEEVPDTKIAWRKAILAAEVLLEMKLARAEDRDYGRILVARLRDRLVMLLRCSALPPVERAEAGRILGRLGDPRPEVMTVEHMSFGLVPRGPFFMGSDPDDDPEAAEDEAPCHEFDLDYDFWIGRYPVTHAQFKQFVEEGYATERFWTEAGRGWRDGSGGWRPPDDFLGLPNHPVVGVAWYEAVAYTRWMTEHLRDRGLLPGNWEVALPSEAEWEKAARGGARIPVSPIRSSPATGWQRTDDAEQRNTAPRRRYPWGDADPEPEMANYAETKIKSTSAVGCFSSEKSTIPYGVEDLAGNVWEWTRSLRGGSLGEDSFRYPYKIDEREDVTAGDEMFPVLRGGSFYDYAGALRGAARYWYSPNDRDDAYGFRVVVRPSSLTSDASGR